MNWIAVFLAFCWCMACHGKAATSKKPFSVKTTIIPCGNNGSTIKDTSDGKRTATLTNSKNKTTTNE